MRITGTISRLVREEGKPDRIFFLPDPGQDFRELGTSHRLASGEMWIAGELEGRKVGEVLEVNIAPDVTL